MGKGTKEQEYLDDLEELVRENYIDLERNVLYFNHGTGGELDLMCLTQDGGWDVYEVKATSRKSTIKTAMNQLDRARHNAPYTVYETYIYIGRTKELIYYRGD